MKAIERLPETAKIGTPVMLISDERIPIATVTTSEPWQLGHGAWVVRVEGKSGGYSLDRVFLHPELSAQAELSRLRLDAIRDAAILSAWQDATHAPTPADYLQGLDLFMEQTKRVIEDAGTARDAAVADNVRLKALVDAGEVLLKATQAEYAKAAEEWHALKTQFDALVARTPLAVGAECPHGINWIDGVLRCAECKG